MYAVISNINGNWKIEVETNNLQQAEVNYHGLCESFWNASDVEIGYVWLVDRSLKPIEKAEIHHDTDPEQTEAAE